MAILLPGVPKEAEPMFKNQVVPMLKRLETGVIISKYIRTIGITSGGQHLGHCGWREV